MAKGAQAAAAAATLAAAGADDTVAAAGGNDTVEAGGADTVQAGEAQGGRVPIVARGRDLIAMIADTYPEPNEDGSDGELTQEFPGYLMLTQEEGQDLVSAGYAVVNSEIFNADDKTAAVSLTEQGWGQHAVQNQSVSTSIQVRTDIPIPSAGGRRGRNSSYPFESMEVGHSFHVAKSAENPDPVNRLASSVSGARTKYSHPDPTGKTEEVVIKEYQRVEGGNGYAKDADGKRIVTGERKETRPVRIQDRDWLVKAVDKSDPEGEGARCWRIK